MESELPREFASSLASIAAALSPSLGSGLSEEPLPGSRAAVAASE
jgi:hypothetical protein